VFAIISLDGDGGGQYPKGDRDTNQKLTAAPTAMNQGLGSHDCPLRRFSGSMFNLPGCHQVQSQHLEHQDLKPRLHEIASCLAPFQASATVVYRCVPKMYSNTVDGSEIRRSPVEVGSLSHYLQGFMHSRWWRISSINSTSYGYISCLTSCR